MNSIFNSSESSIRLIVFVGVLVAMLLLESLFPRKQRVQHRKKRWLTNFSLVFIDGRIVLIFNWQPWFSSRQRASSSEHNAAQARLTSAASEELQGS